MTIHEGSAYNPDMHFFREPERRIPVLDHADVIVCGGGPAGVSAAVAAARQGARTVLLERGGALGGIMTSGLMSYIIDSENKKGLLREIINDLIKLDAKGRDLVFDNEIVKYYLETLCLEAGVKIRLHTVVTAAYCDEDKQLKTIVSESKSGREAWQAKIFIDCTGDGDLAALSGCSYELGRSKDGALQPMSLCALLYNVQLDSIPELCRIENNEGKYNLFRFFQENNCTPSYSMPTLFQISSGSYLLMSNHQYGFLPLDTDSVTRATVEARAELHRQLQCLRAHDIRFANARFGATADYIGVREGRRISGLYRITREDLLEGKRHPDAVCRMRFGADVHSPSPEEHKGYSHDGCPKVKPYDIPLRSLIAKDVKGLMMAGRCICGDFHAHASYRVIGGAVPMGEAAGVCAALAVKMHCLPQNVPFRNIANKINLQKGD